MKKWSPLPWLVLSILFSAIPLAHSRAWLPCEPECNCTSEHFCSCMNGQAVCRKCINCCSEKKNMIEVTSCTERTNRLCQCMPGYFCPSPVSMTCRRDCEPCTNGFTDTSNLNRSCQPYRDCVSLGMVVITEGSRTSDRACGTPIPKPLTATSDLMKTLHTADKPDTLSTALHRLLSSTHKLHVIQTTDNSSVRDVTSETTAPSGKIEEIMWTGRAEGPDPLSEPPSKTTWSFLLLLFVILCLLPYLYIKCKSRSIKNKLEWAGRAFARYQPVLPNYNTEMLGPVSNLTDAARDVREAQGQGSSSGKIQQVTMEHVGKSDGVNNTVGSIFIYSPGMVILGSNSNEKKEEAEPSGEDVGEVACLMSVPQQESSSEEDIRLATQEELDKELSVPVPATSK